MDKATIATPSFPWSNIISLFGIFLGAFITVLIFKLGINFQTKKEKKKEREKYDQLELYLLKLIDYFILAIDHQIGHIGRCSQALKDYSQHDFGLPVSSALISDELLNFKDEDFYKVFVARKKGIASLKVADLIHLRSSFRYVEQQKRSYDQFNDETKLQFKELVEEWNKHWGSLHDLYNHFAEDAYIKNISPGEDDFLDKYKAIVVEAAKNTTQGGFQINLKLHFENVIEPLIKLINIPEFQNDKRCSTILSPLIGCRQAFIQINKLRYDKRKYVLHLGRMLITAKNLIVESTKNHKSRESY